VNGSRLNGIAQNPVKLFGAWILEASEIMGRVSLLVRSVFFWLWYSKLEFQQTVIQMARIGMDSLPVTMMTSFFTGMVLSLQSGTTSKDLFNEPLYVGTVVGYSMVMELGPVLTALVVSGRAGAAVTAEIGTMRVTEQIDALHTLGTDPVRYLAIPRYIAFFFMLPILTLFSDFSGVFGGYVIAISRLGVPAPTYWHNIFDFMKMKTVYHGLIKTFFFAFAIATVCIYKGINTRGGAEGVGRATTQAVVVSMVSVLLLDYFVTAVLISLNIV
jgi:phospholipid/cholesterol/gamma-HCH transport system permease protein